jgi:N-acetylmuramoyl-L-alanine amidase
MKHLVREVFFMWKEITLKLRDGMFWLQLVCALITFALFFWLVEADASEYGWGSRGDAVRQIQQKLRQYGYMTSAADGVFGKDTYDAVVWFQKKNGLRVDGIVGKSTAAALGLSLSGTVSAAAYNESETYMLARLVHGEARGEPYVGKVAVAAVVLNRVKSPLFPNTISGVIFQAGAFDAVSDGQYNLTPDADSIRAAKDALGGWDPSGGCLYYYNPVTSTNEWIWTRTVQLSIGKHNFAI